MAVKTNDLMRVFDEYTWSGARRILEDNIPFCVDDGVFAVLRLDSSQVDGGLNSKNAKKNEDVGSFINAVQHQQLPAFATREMLEKSFILLIPTATALQKLSEYDFLIELEWPVVLLTRDGEGNEIQETVSLSFDTLREIGRGDLSVRTALNMDPFLSSDEMQLQITEVDETISDESSADIESQTAENNVRNDEISSDGKHHLLIEGDSIEQVSHENDDDTSENDVQIEEQEEEPSDAHATIGTSVAELIPVSASLVDETMQRNLYARKQAVALSSDQFDNTFRHCAFSLPVPSEQGWLNAMIAFETVKANAQLAQLHEENIESLRRSYLSLLEDEYARILERTSLESGADNHFARALEERENERKESIDNLEERVREQSIRLREDYAKKRQAYVDRAAASAEVDYDSKFSRHLAGDIEQLHARLLREIDANYYSQVASIKEQRLEKIQSLMDIATRQTLEKMTVSFTSLIENERNLRDAFEEQIRCFAEGNKENEMHRINVLDREIERDNQLALAREESQKHLSELREDFAGVREALQADYEAVLKRHKIAMEEEDEKRRNLEEVKNSEIKRLKNELNDMRGRFADVEAEKKKEVEEQVVALNDANKALVLQLEESIKARQRASWINFGLVATASVVAGLFGLLVGSYFLY